MPIPDYQTLMPPVLRLAADGYDIIDGDLVDRRAEARVQAELYRRFKARG